MVRQPSIVIIHAQMLLAKENTIDIDAQIVVERVINTAYQLTPVGWVFPELVSNSVLLVGVVLEFRWGFTPRIWSMQTVDTT